MGEQVKPSLKQQLVPSVGAGVLSQNVKNTLQIDILVK